MAWARATHAILAGSTNHGYVREWGASYPILLRQNYSADECCVTVLDGGKAKTWTVNTESIVVPRLCDDYGPASIGRDKIVANTLVAELMRGQRTVVVLDTECGLSASFLKCVGVEEVHVPNPNPALAGLDGIVWHECPVLDFLRDVVRPQGMRNVSYWLDYCCTFAGDRSKTVPKVDLELLFLTRSLAREKGVLAMTFSTRGVVGGARAAIAEVDAFLAGRGYRFERKVTHVYAKMILVGYITV